MMNSHSTFVPSIVTDTAPVVALVLIGILSASSAMGDEQPSSATYKVGVAKVDITPSYPIRLNGFGGRRTESEGITQRIWAKALAIESEGGAPVVIVTLDSLGIREAMVNEAANRLKEKA